MENLNTNFVFVNHPPRPENLATYELIVEICVTVGKTADNNVKNMRFACGIIKHEYRQSHTRVVRKVKNVLPYKDIY